MTAPAHQAATSPEVAAPAGRLVGAFAPGTDGWRQARSGCITATRIAAVLGLSPWESPFSLWHRMRGTVTDEIEQSPEMEWGTRLEPAVVGKFADEHPDWDIRETGTWARADRPWQRATPDRVRVEDGRVVGVVEAKTSPTGEGWGDGVPVYYEAQVQWQLDTLGVDVCHVAVLISGHDYREYEITAAPDDQAFMRERARVFLDSIAAGTAPKIDGHKATYSVVRALPDGVDDIHVDIGPHLADRYRDAREAHKATETELTEAKSLVLDRLGRALRAEALGELIAYRTTYPDGKTRALQPARRENRKAQ